MNILSRWQVFEGAVNDVIADESGTTFVAASTSAYNAEKKMYSSNELAFFDGTWRKRIGVGPLAFCSGGRGVIARVQAGRAWVSQRFALPAFEPVGEPGTDMSAVAGGLMDATIVRARYWQKDVRGGCTHVFVADAARGFLPQLAPAEGHTMRACISADGSFALVEGFQQDDTLYGYATPTGTQRWSIKGGASLRLTGSTAALSSKGTRGMATASYRCPHVIVFGTRSGTVLGDLGEESLGASVLSWSSGDRVALGWETGEVWVADLAFASATAAPVIRQSWTLTLGTASSPVAVTALGFSGDKTKLAVGTSDGGVSLLGIE